MSKLLKEFNARYIQETNVVLLQAKYGADSSTALMLKDGETGEPLCTATVCLVASNEFPSEGCVFIKDWSENEGVLKALQDNGIVGEVIRSIPTGYVEAYECKLLVEVGE